MIEEVIINYLTDKLGFPVYMEVPEKVKTVPFVIVEKTGSSMENHIKRATIVIQSYGATLYKAAQTNETVKNTMLDIVSLDEISKCSLNGDYNYTDTANKRYRYQAVFDLVHY